MVYLQVQDLGPDWQPQGIPSNYHQIVAITPPVTYSELMHNSPPSVSGYFEFPTAYDTDRIKECGYKFVKRVCDGRLETPLTTNPPIYTVPRPTFIPKSS